MSLPSALLPPAPNFCANNNPSKGVPPLFASHQALPLSTDKSLTCTLFRLKGIRNIPCIRVPPIICVMAVDDVFNIPVTVVVSLYTAMPEPQNQILLLIFAVSGAKYPPNPICTFPPVAGNASNAALIVENGLSNLSSCPVTSLPYALSTYTVLPKLTAPPEPPPVSGPQKKVVPCFIFFM